MTSSVEEPEKKNKCTFYQNIYNLVINRYTISKKEVK